MRQLIIVAFFVLICSAFGYGQASFAANAVGEGKTDEALEKCGALPDAMPDSGFYNPLQKSYFKAVSYFEAKKNHWSCMWTGARYQWKSEPAGSKYGVTANGDFSFEGHAGHGIRACHNRVLAIFYTEITVVTSIPTPTPVAPVATPTPVQEPLCKNVDMTIAQARKVGLLITDEGNCVPKEPKPVEKDCPECPDDVDASVEASTKTRLTGGLTSTAVSAGIACGVSGVLNKDWKDCAVDAAISAGSNRVVQFVNPSPDTVKFTANGKTKKFRRGKNGQIGDCEVSWKGDTAILTCGDQECMRVPLPKNFNTTVFAMKRGAKVPIKTQTPSQIPDRGGVADNNGGRIPGGGVPVIPNTGIETRPRRPFAEESNNVSRNTQSSVTKPASIAACNGTLRTIRGEQRCIQ